MLEYVAECYFIFLKNDKAYMYPVVFVNGRVDVYLCLVAAEIPFRIAKTNKILL
jgi:hypothetical protein